MAVRAQQFWLWPQFGKLAFWLSWPALWLVLRRHWRTRVVVVAGDKTGDKKVLLVKSWLGTNQWGLPGGGLHRGEASEPGALRELREETGLRLRPGDLKPLYSGAASHYGLHFNYHCFYVELPRPLTVRKQLLEITNVAWQSLDSLEQQTVTGDTWAALAAWRKL